MCRDVGIDNNNETECSNGEVMSENETVIEFEDYYWQVLDTWIL